MPEVASLVPGCGPLIAEIDLESDTTWTRLSFVEVRSPARLVCEGLDPQVEIELPFELHTRLSSVLMELVVESSIDGRLEVFWDLGTGMSQEQSQAFELWGAPGRLQTLRARLPPGIMVLRIDPLDRPGIVDVRSIRFFEPEPSGPAHFPFRALASGVSKGRRGWLDIPEVQQAVALRLMGGLDAGWPEWLFRRLLVGPFERCLHLGATDGLFGSLLASAQYVGRYTGVPGDLMDRDETIRLRSTSRVRWSSFDEALAAAPYDLVLTTGFWSRGRPGPNAQEIEAAMSADGLLVMLERFTKPEPVSDQLLSRVLSMLVSALPSGWQALEPNRHPEPPGCRLETDFAARFECREIRPFGGTIAQPLIERLQPDFLQLGAGTLMGAVTGTYLALEETLILTGLLVSPFNLLVASRRGSELQVTRKVPTGWAIAPSTDLSALISAPAPPTS